MSRMPRVLVVDDDPSISTRLVKILNTSGFEAVAAFSRPEALKLAHASGFDILVMDVTTAPSNGLKTAITFRNINPSSHVLLFTGPFEAGRLMMDAANAGYDFRVFARPLDPARIIDTLRSTSANSLCA